MNRQQASQLGGIVADAVERRFPNGIRLDTIDLMKLRRELPPDLDIDDVVLRNLVAGAGFQHEDTIHVVSREKILALVNLIERQVFDGQKMFWYSEIFSVHSDFFSKINIFNCELVKEIIESRRFVENLHDNRIYFNKNFFRIGDKIKISDEIDKLFVTHDVLSYDDIKNIFPYIPIKEIKHALGNCDKFIFVGQEKYTHISKIIVSDRQKKEIMQNADYEIEKNGYFSLSSIDVSDILSENQFLSIISAQTGIFNTCFKDKYVQHGKIVSRKEKEIKADDIFVNFCRTRKSFTFDELLSLEKEIIGNTQSRLSLLVATDLMIRVSKDLFVSEDSIHFDVEAIDHALNLFVHDDVIPLRSVTSFSTFPYIGEYAWNLFIIESFCRRFSRLFKFQCPVVNSKNGGAIFRKSANFKNYLEVQAAAVAKSDIALTEKDIDDFLFSQGYVASRCSKRTLPEILLLARRLRG